MDIATGNSESHPSLLPYDPSASPGVAPVTATEPGQDSRSGGQGAAGNPVYADQMSAEEAACTAAQTVGQQAENNRRGHYAAVAAGYAGMGGGADLMALPPVPAAAVPAASSDLYPKPGDEPFPQ
jgi:hypothetical protein